MVNVERRVVRWSFRPCDTQAESREEKARIVQGRLWMKAEILIDEQGWQQSCPVVKENLCAPHDRRAVPDFDFA